MADNSRVEIPKSWLAALGGGLLVCLLALAFLLGRSSAPAPVTPAPIAAAPPPVRVELDNPAPVPPAQVEIAAPVVAAPAPPPPPAPAPVEPEPPTADNVSSAPMQRAPAPAEPVVVSQPPPPVPVRSAPVRPRRRAPVAPRGGLPGGDRAAISNYLSQVNAVTAQSGDLGDPNQIANTVLQQSVNGDNSGLNDLGAKSRQALAQLRAITPPPAAREHYQLLLKTTQSSVALLDQLKSSTASGDMSGLGAISAKGQSMQADAQRLETLTQELKAQAAGQ